ncbi:MAG: SH3 domain-containing protein, partial [Thermoanaerobaculia bacterium]
MQEPGSDRRTSRSGIAIILALGLLFFSLVGALVIFSGREPAAEKADLEDLYVVPPTLRLRASPSLEAPILANLERGERLDQLGMTETWANVRREDDTVGWSERLYLETKTDHERRVARYTAIRLLPPLEGKSERSSPLYSGPGIFFPVIGEIGPDQTLKIYTRDHDFYAIETGGNLAFIEADAVDLSGAGAAVFEVAASQRTADIEEEEPTLTASIPDFEPPFPDPPSDFEPFEPPPTARDQPPPAPSRGPYPGVPPGGTEPVVISRVMPRYPPAARGGGVEGTAVVRAVVRRNGRVGKVEVLRDPGMGLG